MCAENNLQICNASTPAQYFHLLRRQLHRDFRKPLAVMTPKSLLRHKLAVSPVEEFTSGSFMEVLDDTNVDSSRVKRVVLCSGKVYYDLYQAREDRGIKDIALVRIEQLYPFPKEEMKAELKKYKNAEVIWCQEEPKNMGAWKFVDDLIEEALIETKHKTARPKYVGRIACASPATGYGSYHAREQKAVIEEALK
jgi:2-oxoglutarate dehydrogenase E1 component